MAVSSRIWTFVVGRAIIGRPGIVYKFINFYYSVFLFMNISLRQLRALVAVARAGSFTAAARDLGMTQSAVSAAVRNLEADLGLPLFRRDTRNVAATELGQNLAAQVERQLADLEATLEAARRSADRQRGLVRIAAIPSAVARLLPRCLADCRARFPDIHITIADLAAEDVIPTVLAGRADFGIVNERARGTGPLPPVVVTALGRDPFCLVCRRDDALARKAQPAWRDLAGREVVLPDRRSGSRALIEKVLKDAGVTVQVVQEMARPEALAGLVAARIGVAVLPELSVPDEEHPTLTWRRLTAPAAHRRMVIVQAPGGPLSGPAALVVENVKRLFAARGGRT